MRYTVTLLLISILVTAKAQHQVVTAIQQVLAAQQAAWNSGNITQFMQGYWRNDSLQFVGKSGVTYGWNNTLANYKKGYASAAEMGQLQFTIMNTKKVSRKYYSILGKWQLTRSMGNIGGYFTLLFKKIKGKWLIVSDHSS